ncbi:hypothetical protein IV203_000079 (plastid) [Nitzschia inconspicua]|uniref:Uncharacterized protein n=1 Tax=Nitzschia inconspicua TaxID=303405 RepID=A0A8H2SI33_9STRA|nr:hypothetical protein IV203_000015 [Nitzschia inconspicua]QXE46157.1 hypothetical protein IV203_000079 [Nitzschia inconspicua]
MIINDNYLSKIAYFAHHAMAAPQANAANTGIFAEAAGCATKSIAFPGFALEQTDVIAAQATALDKRRETSFLLVLTTATSSAKAGLAETKITAPAPKQNAKADFLVVENKASRFSAVR